MKVDFGQNVLLVVSSFRHADFRSRLGEIPVRFVSWSPLSFRRFVMSFHRFVMSFRRFVMSFRRFVVSTRPLREAIIRRTLHEEFT